MLRFLVPNGITSISIVLAVLSVEASLRGDSRSAAWWILYCVLTDKLDGIAARKLGASSPFGVQLDSLADLCSFGVAPAALLYGFFRAHPDAGWSTEIGRASLVAIGALWACCTAWRLARFNVMAEHPNPDAAHFFYGVPSTFAGGIAASLMVVLIKYGAPSWGGGDALRLLGPLRLDGAMAALPIAMVPLALLMVSTLRVPKIGRTRWPIATALVVGNVVLCYAVGLCHRLPEWLALSSLGYLAASGGYHLASTRARAIKAPPVFPAVSSSTKG